MFAYGEWDDHFGELVQGVYKLGANEAIAVELDASQHPHPNRVVAGAAPLESIDLFVYALAGRELARLIDRIFDVLIDWIVRHRGESQETVDVNVYGPDERVIKTVHINPDGKAWERSSTPPV